MRIYFGLGTTLPLSHRDLSAVWQTRGFEFKSSSHRVRTETSSWRFDNTFFSASLFCDYVLCCPRSPNMLYSQRSNITHQPHDHIPLCHHYTKEAQTAKKAMNAIMGEIARQIWLNSFLFMSFIGVPPSHSLYPSLVIITIFYKMMSLKQAKFFWNQNFCRTLACLIPLIHNDFFRLTRDKLAGFF